MTKQEFITLFEELLEVEPGTISGDETLEELEGWNSLATVSFIAMADEHLGITPAPQKIEASKSVQDLIELLGDNITD